MKERAFSMAHLLFSVLSLSLISANIAMAQGNLVTLGTGGITGNYYRVGVELGDQINKNMQENGFRFAVETTKGSVFNGIHVINNELDLGLMQSDIQYELYNGQGTFENRKNRENLCSIMSLIPEHYYIITRNDGEIKNFSDLQGKKISLGNRLSGQHETGKRLLEAAGWTENSFSEIQEIKSNEMASALCGKQVDAVTITIADRAPAITEIANQCNIQLIAIPDSVLQKLSAKYPYYTQATIPGNLYTNVSNSTSTFAVTSTLVTDKSESDDVIYCLTKSIFENLDALKQVDPAFSNLTKEEMVNTSMAAPLHPGAKKYYKELHLL